jgi:HPt (histidine-containing phosphotransfer) domain-containing protein
MSLNYTENSAAHGPAIHFPETGSNRFGPKDSESLISWENMAEYVGDDRETQLQVVRLCLNALATRLPLIQSAINGADRVLMGKIAHDLRGSLGMLGLPELVSLSEQIEYEHDSLGERRWLNCCREFHELLKRVNVNLRQLQAA